MTRMRRTEHIRLRLVPADQGPPIEVVLSLEERNALEQAIAESGYLGGLSTFLRECAVRAAKDYAVESPLPADAILAASTAAFQGVGEWIRNVALVAVGASDLLPQLQYAQTEFEAGAALWGVAVIDEPAGRGRRAKKTPKEGT